MITNRDRFETAIGEELQGGHFVVLSDLEDVRSLVLAACDDLTTWWGPGAETLVSEMTMALSEVPAKLRGIAEFIIVGVVDEHDGFGTSWLRGDDAAYIALRMPRALHQRFRRELDVVRRDIGQEVEE